MTDTTPYTEDDIIALVRSLTDAGGTPPHRRDIAKALKVKGEARAALRKMLSALEADGKILLEGKKARIPGSLPPVTLYEAVAIDGDGDLIAAPVKADQAPPGLKLLIDPRWTNKVGIGTRFLGRAASPMDETVWLSPIKVLDREPPAILGVYAQGRARGKGTITPVSRKANTAYVVAAADRGDAKEGDLVRARPLRGRAHGPKAARVTEVLGNVDDRRNWSLIALAEQDIPIDFPEEVTREADAVTFTPTSDYLDWTDLPFITIDPADAKDHDDAVFVERKDDGGFIVRVAIADVSWFVTPESALDREAVKRGNSVYLADRVVPMLPEVLSNGLCSLKAGEVRPSLVCEMHLTAEGERVDHHFVRALIKSAAGLSYTQAQDAANGTPGPEAEALSDTVITPLFEVYRAMVDAKAKRPGLDLDLPERRLVLAPDGAVLRVETKDRLDAHRLIETMMVEANVCAAETLEQKGAPLIYRVHSAPQEDRLDSLKLFLSGQNYPVPKSDSLRPIDFNRTLAKAAERGETDIIAMAILRAQSQAIYDVRNDGHFGLNLARYAHFTSPIRRYADLTVHRALVKYLGLGKGGASPGGEARLERVAEDISMTERRAITAERSTFDRFIAGHLEGELGATFKGRISGMSRAGLFVALDETGADGFIPARTLGADYYQHDEANGVFIGERTRKGYKLAQPVDVRLVEVTPLQGGLRFELLTPPAPLGDTKGKSRAPRKKHKHPGRRGPKRR